jgi:uncharacterized membrane protein
MNPNPGRLMNVLGVFLSTSRKLLAKAKKIFGRLPLNRIPEAILFIMLGFYVLVFTATIFSEFNNLWFGNFDLGIFDQGIWLLSQLKNPYLTTRGLNLFGDHATFIHIIIAPIYWFWNNVKALLFLHTLALGLGAVPLYKIAKEKLKNNWTPLIICFSYFMLPALHFSNLDQGYHSESFVVPLILWAHWFLMKKEFKKFYLSIFLALMCKEEIALTIFLYGIYAAYKYNRRAGVTVSLCAVVWMLFVLNLVFPFFNGSEGAFYTSRTFGSFGETTNDKISNALNPGFIYAKLNTAENQVYVRKLLEPVGYLVFLEPIAFICAANLWLNLLQDWPYAHQIQYHYVSPIIPIMYISLVEGISRFSKRRTLTGIILGILLISSIQGNYNFSPDESTLRNAERPVNEIMNFDKVSQDKQEVLKMLALIPGNASVSAIYNIVPQISHREKIYMFPNPFRVSYFGVEDRAVPPDNYTDYVFLDINQVGDEERFGTVDKITKSGNYTLIDKYEQYELWKRTPNNK